MNTLYMLSFILPFVNHITRYRFLENLALKKLRGIHAFSAPPPTFPYRHLFFSVICQPILNCLVEHENMSGGVATAAAAAV